VFPFRAVVVSIVVTLAAAPNAALLCRAWCHPQVPAASACHHEKPSTASSVVADPTSDECDQVAVGAAQFLREDVRRSVSDPDVDHATLVPPCYQLAQLTIDGRPGREPGRQGPLEQRSLPTVLRI
jgi:hypothetical protein